ncbi:hypothetical protein [Pantoea sp. 1.19]|uniref:hypothetical protein n=1 Tax=Pantoea sp. 1.19 TaxID=1925589 RepID=UPI000948A7E0|nr:hypothetical protein [Pantoea sp. 1.19]
MKVELRKKALNILLMTLAISAKADETLPFVAFHNSGATLGANSAAIFSLNEVYLDSAQLVGSLEYPILSSNTSLTVATYVPTSVNNSGVGRLTDPFVWRYAISNFSDIPFTGSYCSSCSGGYKPALKTSSSQMTIPYNPIGGLYGKVGLTLSSPFFNKLLSLGSGAIVNISTSPYENEQSDIPLSTQNNSLMKVGDFYLDNSAKLAFLIDPITGEISLKNSTTGQRCTDYQYIALKGQLCEVMKYRYQGNSVTPYAGMLSMTVSDVNDALNRFQSSGLTIALTFDEKNWYSLSNASVGNGMIFADSFMQQAAKAGGTASLKMFFPNDFIKQVALSGQESDLTDIATLCISKPMMTIGADFCFHPGNGMNIDPMEPNIEIKPDNPDYTLDPKGYGASGQGTVGSASPITIPYTIYTISEDPAVAVSVRVTGPSRALKGKNYCLFSGSGAAAGIAVPVPGDVLIGASRQKYAHNCAGESFPVAAPATAPGEWLKKDNFNVGALNVWQTPLILEFPMNDPVTTKTYSGTLWDGIVSAQGTVEVSATWN